MFKIGDKIRGISDERYIITNTEMYEAEVIKIYEDMMEIKITKHKDKYREGNTHCVDNSELYFKLIKGKKIEEKIKIKGLGIKEYIINKNACVIYWDDGDKTIVKRGKDEEFNKEVAFLNAYFQKKCGLSKTQANKFLRDLIVREK